jgi:hypothetical protein
MSRVTSGDSRGQLRKSALSRAFHGGLRLALLSLLAGCLLPQSVDPIDTRAHIPPSILVESIPTDQLAPLLPLDHTTSTDTAVRCKCSINLTVNQIEEDDPAVDLVARWFVDYDVNVPRSVAIVKQIPLAGTFDNTQKFRGPVVYEFQPDAVGIASNDSSVHMIDLVVGETVGFDDNKTAPAPPFRTMKAGYEAAVYRFAVQLAVPAPGAPCRGQLPAQRVCGP